MTNFFSSAAAAVAGAFRSAPGSPSGIVNFWSNKVELSDSDEQHGGKSINPASFIGDMRNVPRAALFADAAQVLNTNSADSIVQTWNPSPSKECTTLSRDVQKEIDRMISELRAYNPLRVS